MWSCVLDIEFWWLKERGLLYIGLFLGSCLNVFELNDIGFGL